MVDIIQCGDKNLPRDLDVQISVSRRTFETETDLSVAVAVVKDGPLLHGAGRIQYFTALDQVTDAGFLTTQEGYKAARDFFAQPARARTMAIGQVFEAAQAGFARYGALGTLADFQAVTDGEFAIAIDGVSNDIAALDFSADLSLDDVAATVETGIQAIASGGFTAATVINDDGQLIITSGTTGAASSVSILAPAAAPVGTDISGAQYLNGLVASPVPGYTPDTLTSELDLVEEAARCSGRFVYGWDLDEQYRDDPVKHLEFAQWVLARTAIGSITSNNLLARDPNNTTDIGVIVEALGSSRLDVNYHDNPEFYPGMAVFAQMLGVNYGIESSVRTAKFLDLEGVPTTGLTVTEFNVLDGKGYNVHSATGNASRVWREGTTSNAPLWFLDQRITLDNYAEELSVELFNLIKTGKLGINAEGQTLEQDAIDTVNERYVFNGALSARQDLAPNTREGFVVLPPYKTTLTPLSLHSDADRAARKMTPALVELNLTDFAHTISVSVLA